MNQNPRNRGQRIFRTLAAVLASGSLFQTCETRLRDAFVSGARDYVLSLFDPTAIIENLDAMDDADITP